MDIEIGGTNQRLKSSLAVMLALEKGLKFTPLNDYSTKRCSIVLGKSIFLISQTFLKNLNCYTCRKPHQA